MIWALQDAKNKFSELVERAVDDGPQVVTRHGKETVVVLSVDEYKKLQVNRKGLAEFFLSSPLRESGIDLSRNKDISVRNVDL